MRVRYFLALIFSVALVAGQISAFGKDFQPAMIGQGPQSVASKLHFPDKARAAKTEGAAQFYCEVDESGRARHVVVFSEKQLTMFREAVQKALDQGRFSPAQVGGKPALVMIGGTVFFMTSNAQPTILVSLTTADKSKAAAGGNYMQPQMLTTFAALERKVYARKELIKQLAAHPVAEVLLNVDQNGNVTNKKILTETTPNGGFGADLMQACDGAKFIPAYADGKPVAGQFNLPMDFTVIVNPDSSESGSHLKPRDY